MSVIPVSEATIYIIFTIPPEQLIHKRWQQIPVQQAVWHQNIPESALLVHCVELSMSLCGRCDSPTLHLQVNVCTFADRAHGKVEFCIRRSELYLAALIIFCIFALECTVLEIKKKIVSAKHCSYDFTILPAGRSRKTTWWPCVCLFMKNFFRDIISAVVFSFFYFLKLVGFFF